MRIIIALSCLVVSLAGGATASAQTQRYDWADIDCRQSRIAAWSGMKCRATNVVTSEGNIGAFRQWAAFGTGPDRYYAHLFVWEAQNSFSYVPAEVTTAEFVRWMFEHGKAVTQVSSVARYKNADYVSFRDDNDGRSCVGFRRLGDYQRGGYASVTGAILCAPSGKTITDKDVFLFVDSVRYRP
jgi:hypothetical protein